MSKSSTLKTMNIYEYLHLLDLELGYIDEYKHEKKSEKGLQRSYDHVKRLCKRIETEYGPKYVGRAIKNHPNLEYDEVISELLAKFLESAEETIQ